MSYPAPAHDSALVMEVDARPAVCLASGCGGAVVRHSLGGGVAVGRCMRCFRRYEVRRPDAPEHREPPRHARDEFIA